MKEFQRDLNTTVIHNSNTDLGSNSNLQIFKVIVLAIITLNCIVIDLMSEIHL